MWAVSSSESLPHKILHGVTKHNIDVQHWSHGHKLYFSRIFYLISCLLFFLKYKIKINYIYSISYKSTVDDCERINWELTFNRKNICFAGIRMRSLKRIDSSVICKNPEIMCNSIFQVGILPVSQHGCLATRNCSDVIFPYDIDTVCSSDGSSVGSQWGNRVDSFDLARLSSNFISLDTIRPIWRL